MVKNIVIAVLIICVIAQFLAALILNKKKEKKIEDLITYLTLVQDRLALPELKEIKEGQLGILQSEIYKVVVLLREAYSKEARQKKYMADMLSDISHQIKTPIAAITIMADLLESSEVSESQRLEYADKIDKQANRITWLIRNLLTLSQLEADVLEFKRQQVDLGTLTRRLQEALEIMAEVKNIKLSIELKPDIVICCDEHWTMEALMNIVKNSIEHTREGGVVRLTAAQDNVATHIHVTDNGEGIAKEHLPHIFERFYKAGNSSPNSIGIGLSMAKQIILKQNGTITVTSEKGVGTDFYVKLFRTDTI